MTPASRSLTSPGNQIPAQPVAAAPAGGRIRSGGGSIADLPVGPYPVLTGPRNLRAAQDKAPEPAGSPAI